MVLYEIGVGKTPFQGYTSLQVVRALDCGKRPPIPSFLDAKFANLMERCWHQDFRMRPEFSDIVRELEQIKME